MKQIELSDNYKILHLSDDTTVNTRSVIITTGVDDFTGAGVYYGAATTEAGACRNEDVYVVGGGNSAGQAAMYLSKFARSVHIIIRKPDLTPSMSSYLIDQIDQTENIEVHGHTELLEAKGVDRLQSLVLRNNESGEEYEKEAGALFIFIGAKPVTEWLSIDVVKNDRGFLETGNGLMKHPDYHQFWKRERDPYMLETCVPGIFAAGDVRAGAMNRVA